MALEPEGNGEVCSVTGTEANARFTDGIGSAWFGSRHDLDRMVDLSGKYDGPVCDDVIERAIDAGEIVVYAYAGGGRAMARRLREEAAAIVFAKAALR
jgi:hypothetical protein